MNIITAQKLDSPFNVALVVSCFNEAIVEKLLEGTMERLKELNVTADETLVRVPGAVEIPLVLQRLAKTGNFEVMIALGAVIRGETGHYDYVCKQVSDGCQKISLQYNIPIVFGVLTTDDEEQALERVGGPHGHKGREAAEVACHIVSILRQIYNGSTAF